MFRQHLAPAAGIERQQLVAGRLPLESVFELSFLLVLTRRLFEHTLFKVVLGRIEKLQLVYKKVSVPLRYCSVTLD